LSEDELINGCVAEKPAAQSFLFKKYAGKMLAVCSRYASDRDEAEDILQEGFVKVFLHIAKFKRESSLETWITRIMINQALTHIKRNSHSRDNLNIEELQFDIVDDDGNKTLQHLSGKDLIGMIQKLPEGYRAVFNLYAIEGYSHKEIGEMLNISENTSKSQFSRARQVLMKLIGNSDYIHAKQYR
jgi:RNA polymerase sigma factor (sigma-70 family)